MPYNFLLPIVSSSAGDLSDGALIGQVNESGFVASMSDKSLSDNIYVYRKNKTGSNFTFDNLTSVASDDTTGDFLPFGDNTQMSAGDELYIGCDHTPKELFFTISTAGNWAGSIDFKYSTNGTSANATLQGVTDNSNGFRNAAGTYAISFTAPTDMVAWSPVPDEITARKFIVLKPNITSVTTAPILTRAWIRHSVGWFTDVTTAINDMAAPSSAPSTFFPVVDSAHYFAFSNSAFGFERWIYKATANVRTRQLEYYANDNTWKQLTGVSDESNDYKNGSQTYTSSPTKYHVRWTVPSDWSSKTLTFKTGDATSVSHTGYWIRNRVVSVQTFGPAQNSKYTIRVKQFGDANTEGIVIPSATTFKYAVIGEPLSESGSGSVGIQIFNLSTGASSLVTIPSSPTYPLNIDITDLSFAAGNKLGAYYSSGTKVLISSSIIIH